MPKEEFEEEFEYNEEEMPDDFLVIRLKGKEGKRDKLFWRTGGENND